jgi:hypothetical protein
MGWGWKIPAFWVIGSICILFGSMIAGSLQRSLGVSESSFVIGLLTALLLFMLGGIFWITVSVAVKKKAEA